MKIAMSDNNGLKFSKSIKEWWEKKGHEVRFERGASEYLAQWADLYYVDWSDNNIHYIYKLYHGDKGVSRPKDWDNKKKPIIVCRAIDWEVWIGFARDQAIVDWVDKWITLAPHIEKKLRAESKYRKNHLKLIRPGIDLSQWPVKTKETDGFQLGMVLGDMWWPKNHMGGLDIFHQLYKQDNKWRLHIRGQHEGGEYWPVMYQEYLESRGIKDVVTLYGPQDTMNEWYEGIDILLHPGMKESFCYAVAEAAAKDIPCVVNEFYGSRDIWPDEWIYQTHLEAISKLNNPTSNSRKYVEDNYSIEKMMNEYDRFLGT